MKVGQRCSFYHEGGRGDRRWVIGWRFGIIRAIPIKGKHKRWVQMEIPVPQYHYDDVKLKWIRKPFARAWVHSSVVNEVGDTIYHGLKLVEEVHERKEAKKKDQAKADKKIRRKL
jgi:hypothetical protein